MSSTKSRGALAAVLAALAGILVLALPAAASALEPFTETRSIATDRALLKWVAFRWDFGACST